MEHKNRFPIRGLQGRLPPKLRSRPRQAPAFPRRNPPGSWSESALFIQRAQGMPGAGWHPRSARGKLRKKRALTHRFSRDNPAFPARWFTAYSALSPVRPGFVVTVTSAMRSISANLAPASGRQDHTASPSASMPFVFDTSASTASRLACRDDRDTPLVARRDGARMTDF
jgi:hypothetical protein